MKLLNPDNYANIETGEILSSELKGKIVNISDEFYLKILLIDELDKIRPVNYKNKLIDEYFNVVQQLNKFKSRFLHCNSTK